MGAHALLMFLRVRAPRLGEAHTPRMDQGDRKNFI
jgi:hypothetical protein